jgi:phosphatidylserine/phosphatidylglycerophosphate/cardiolipin synthase-like enzyme
MFDRLGFVQVDWEGLFSGEALEKVVSSTPAPAPVVSTPITGEWYKLYFSTPIYPDDPAARRETIMTGLIEALNSARRSLDIAIYELNLDPVGDAILAARDRGVNVRLVTDSDSLEEDETLKRLNRAKIPIVPDERGAIMHDKFVVVDGQAVWTGSWNFTINDTYRNNNNAIFIQSPPLAANYTAEFEEMFSQHAFGPTSPANTAYPQVQIGDTAIQVCFAAEDGCADQLINIIGQARQSIRFMAFSFTHEGIGQAVIDRAKAGISVQGVFETRGSETEFSELGLMKSQNLDVWQDGNPYTLHHKVFIIDEQMVVFGSFNFSDNANRSNDENMLALSNSDIAKQFLAEFNRVYAQATSAQ